MLRSIGLKNKTGTTDIPGEWISYCVNVVSLSKHNKY